MNTKGRANLRNDVFTAALIDHGLAMQGIAGPKAAYLYLVQRRIPLLIIKRVMSSPRERRQPGAAGLPPDR
ncbi:hypothetical protein SAMN05518865_108234 [Duganella sp. CF458]|uniref:hypothetical protein n=1 Tax=Duganella sp. CF458 TaxID=1884368 RepID=UPI0008E5C016|nr:hypothetical protein [Duganella sp. CF458]SFG12747.1 hypothetical protein SAMN05518865_108234 [Duganella sp. CF458]